MSDTVLAWHFLPANRRLQYPPHTPVEVGQTLTCEGELALCVNGLHGSVRAIDALRYAPGPIVCRVELSGELLRDNDKYCAVHRKCLAMADATQTLHEFACWCAERVLMGERAAGCEPAPSLWAAVRAKREWLAGKITNEELARAARAAWEASETAALEAIWLAEAEARAAARTAAARAGAATRAATEAATEAAAGAAAGATAWMTTRAAWTEARVAAAQECAAQDNRLEMLLTDLLDRS